MKDQRLLGHLRAQAVCRLASSLILEGGDEEPETAHALRFSLLVLRRPSGYLKIFSGSDLTIDPTMVDRFFRYFGAYVPGPSCIMRAELELLRTHNLAAKNYETEVDCTLHLLKNHDDVFAPQ